MSDIFISYSRRDIDFVRHLFDQLQERDHESWVDWQDILPTADWLAEIYQGIEAADSFLFVISPDSVVSEFCTLEIEHAVKHNKRLIPVVWEDVEDSQVHASMVARNWIFLRQEDDFEAGLELLIGALDTDLVYIREHTRLLTRAIEWHDNDKRRSDVLRGPDLTAAEGWLAISHSMEPRSTDLHGDYIAFSRATVNRLQRLIYSAITVAFAIVLGLAFFAFQQRNQAQKTARASKSQALAAFALMEVDKDTELSILLSTESVKTTYQADGIVLPLSKTVLRQSILGSRIRLTLRGHGDGVVFSVAWSPDGQRIVTGSDDMTAKVWDAETGRELSTLTGHDGGVLSVSCSPDGQRVVTGSEDQTAKVWDAQTERELSTLTGHDGWVMSVSWSPDGKQILTGSIDFTVKVWDAQTGKEVFDLIGHSNVIHSVAWSLSGQRILTGDMSNIAKAWDAQTGQELMTLTGHDHWVSSLSWMPEGKWIATGGKYGLVQVYTTDIDELLQIAESRVTRQLTAEEEETYGVEEKETYGVLAW